MVCATIIEFNYMSTIPCINYMLIQLRLDQSKINLAYEIISSFLVVGSMIIVKLEKI